MKKMLLISLTALLCAACAGTNAPRDNNAAAAAPEPVLDGPETVTIGEYLEFLDALATSIGEGVPRDFNQAEQANFRRVDNSLRDLLASRSSLDELNESQQVRLFNLHEELQAIVIGEPEAQVICRRRHTVGTHFQRTTCKTQDEFDRDQQESQRYLRNLYGSGPLPILDVIQ